MPGLPPPASPLKAMGTHVNRGGRSFSGRESNFVTYANANLAALGLVAADMTPVATAQTGWETAFPTHIGALNAVRAAKQTKDEARAAYVATIRPLVRRLQASPLVFDAERASLGITVM